MREENKKSFRVCLSRCPDYHHASRDALTPQLFGTTGFGNLRDI